MSIPDHYKHRHAFHFSSIENLESILNSGLLSTNRKNNFGINHVNVAEVGIQNRRSSMIVPGSGNRTVHDYVPFYFAQKTPMQLAVLHKKNVDQQFIIYFAVPISILESRQGVYFTDASANTDIPPAFYPASDSASLDKLNWQVIDSLKWAYPQENERHQKMAELSVPDSVSTSEISYIVVWNESIAEAVKQMFASKGIWCPRVVVNTYHYYTDPQDHSYSLVTGPFFLKQEFEQTVERIFVTQSQNKKFPDMGNALASIKQNFSSIKELGDIDGLAANYGPHSDDVGTHSKRVAGLVVNSPEYQALYAQDKIILELAAYFHDIGKGPKTRWANSFMDKADNNHARKSLPMLERILTQDIGGLSNDAIRKLVMLVTYDDLLGDIAANGRDKQQLFDIVTCESDVNMLAALSRADIGAINQGWLFNTTARIEQLKNEAIAFLRRVR